MKKILIILFILFCSDVSSSQNLYFGFHSGFENTYQELTIGNHQNYAMLLEIPLASKCCLTMKSIFFQKKHYGSQWEGELRGTTYTVRDAQLWRNSALTLEFSKYIYKRFYFSAGVSTNLVRFKRITHNPSWPIYINYNDEIVPNEIENRDIKFIRFGMLSGFGWNWSIWKKLILVIEAQYAVLFAGEEFGHRSLNTLESISIWGGFKYGF